MLEDLLLSLSTSKVEAGDREFLIRTGEYGARDFSRAVSQTGSGWSMYNFNADNLGIMKKSGDNSYALVNPQFNEYYTLSNIKCRLEVDAFYDDPVNNKIEFPGGEGKAMSHRFDIFNIGTMDQPNIFKCGIKGQPTEVRSIQWGLRDPYTGRWGNQNMSFEDDKAVIHKMGQFGVCVLDPSRTLSLIPKVLRG